MLPEEKMMLQAMPMKRHQDLVEHTSSATLSKMAGNAWCYMNFVAGFLSAAACMPVNFFEGK